MISQLVFPLSCSWMGSLKECTNRNSGLTLKFWFNIFNDNLEECENATVMKSDSKLEVAAMTGINCRENHRVTEI